MILSFDVQLQVALRALTILFHRNAVAVVLASTSRYRLPEASRKAHGLVNALRQEAGAPAEG